MDFAAAALSVWDLVALLPISYHPPVINFSRLFHAQPQTSLAALDRTNNPFQEVVSIRGSVRLRQREPLAKHLNLQRQPDKVVRFLHANKVHYKEDLTPELFERMAEAPSIGRVSLGRLCSALMRDDFFSDLEFLTAC
jgi:hypothetical protein